MTRSTPSALVLALVAAACTTSPGPTVVPAAPTAATVAPATDVPTPEPTVDQNRLPPTTTTGWWGDPDNPSECMQPGFYRIGYRVAGMGDCLGLLPEGPRTVTLDVGQDMDTHMTIPANGAPPIYSLPEAEDELVALGWLIFDDATLTFRALSPGTTRLVSTGPCERGSYDASAPDTSCAVLVIQVRDIDTECIELADDVCRAAGATAVSNVFAEPGQRIVSWVAKPNNLIGGQDCGELVATVTFTMEDPAATFDVAIGRLVAPSGEPDYVICTY